MTREEAIALLNEQYETCKRIYDCSADQRKSYPNVPQFMEALGIAFSALRPVSREHAEKMWKGRWITVSNAAGETWSKCSECQEELDGLEDAYNFCPRCGAPMTDKAVEMVMERLEKLKNEIG